MPVDGGTTAGKADRPALKADSLAETNTGIPNKTTSPGEWINGTETIQSKKLPVTNAL